MSSTIVSLRKRIDMPRTHAISRKKTGLKILAVVLLIIMFIPQTLPRSSRKRCTPTSPESYCPHPMQCVDTKYDDPSPRPLVVISAGGERAASTFLYNALRILLRIRDPNTVSGWYVDLKHQYDTYAQVMPQSNSVADITQGDRLNAFRSVGSLLVKIHSVRDWHDFLGGGDVDPIMDDVDAVYTSHRDIREAVRSIRDMGWGVAHTDSQMSEKDFCRRKQRKKREIRFFKREDYTRPETWVTVAKSQILCREILLESAGSKLKLDLKAEDISGMEQSEMRALLREMASHLNYTYSDAELDSAMQELKRLRPGGCSNGYDVEMSLNPVTHLHKGHIRSDENGADEKSGMIAIEKDQVCGRWLKQQLYDVGVHYSRRMD